MPKNITGYEARTIRPIGRVLALQGFFLTLHVATVVLVAGLYSFAKDQPQWIVAGMQGHTGTRENRRQGGGVTTTSLQQQRPARRQHPIEGGFAGRQQQSAGAGGLKSLQGRLHTLWIDAPVALPKHSGLGQAGS